MNSSFAQHYAAVIFAMFLHVSFAAVLFRKTDAIVAFISGRSPVAPSLTAEGLALVVVRQVSIWLVLGGLADAGSAG
ncbi:MAG: hypothetical protein ACREFX_09870 [Opitutaceae bacterium]